MQSNTNLTPAVPGYKMKRYGRNTIYLERTTTVLSGEARFRQGENGDGLRLGVLQGVVLCWCWCWDALGSHHLQSLGIRHAEPQQPVSVPLTHDRCVSGKVVVVARNSLQTLHQSLTITKTCRVAQAALAGT